MGDLPLSGGTNQEQFVQLSGDSTGTKIWTRKHLLGLEDLSPWEIQTVLDVADRMLPNSRPGSPKLNHLTGRMVVNLFYEASTRTRVSFAQAARRLGADVTDFSSSGSSVSKGESFIDTARNIEALGMDFAVVRHGVPGTPHLLSHHIQSGIINAGDGAHEHPTQALLDILTIRQRLGRVSGLTVGLVGDIAHSRVARSNIHGLKKLGARVIVCGPPTLIPPEVIEMGVEVNYSLDSILHELDVVNVLRIQFERQRGGLFPSIREYYRLFGVTAERMARAKPSLLLLAPGPINRGVELTPEVADGPNSAILDQVANGLGIRMAVLSLLAQAEANAKLGKS